MKVEFDWPFACILLSLAFQTASVLFGKQAALMIDTYSLVAVASNPFYLASLACLGLQALTWQVALRKYPLSLAYFVTSLLPVNILLVSHFVFDENVSTGNAVGCALVVAGLVVLTRNDKVLADG